MPFNFVAAITICSDFEAPKNKVCHCFKGEQTESKMTGTCEHFSYQPMVQKPLSPGVNHLNGQMDKTAKKNLKKKKEKELPRRTVDPKEKLL